MANKFGSGIGGKKRGPAPLEVSRLRRLPPRGGLLTGFTLAEVLVSMFIFTIITTAVVINYRVGNRNTELRLAAEEMASFIRNAQIMAQAGRTVKLCARDDGQLKVCEADVSGCTTACEAQTPRGGYGIYVRDTTSALIFFANSINPDEKDYNDGENVSTIRLQLPSKVSISIINPSPLTILFEPPRPRTWINHISSGEAQIILRHTDTDATRTITVKSVSGRIEVSP